VRHQGGVAVQVELSLHLRNGEAGLAEKPHTGNSWTACIFAFPVGPVTLLIALSLCFVHKDMRICMFPWADHLLYTLSVQVRTESVSLQCQDDVRALTVLPGWSQWFLWFAL
jgi:hypothetical protein